MQCRDAPDFVLQMRIKALIYEGLALYLQDVSATRIQHSLQLALAQEPVQPALRYIEAHLGEELLNNELARLCHMQVDYFARRFRECVGMTPGHYIQEQRVKVASQKLLFTNHSIEQIAAEVGFGNRFYFSRIFARHTGVSPAAYRKSSRYH
ncbi:helix-turn-helix domain-containing protein [Tengunoibacter tsumagoiensis]|uniref:HTH araC/xylS-type domain-containing protein n=1 Tax=Tengunoibacter tsumagoiensis TaxID=2014871 RepID=A0A402AA68_9CHLR|nr:AraC family transcriptional regulator [Tengunoibacter tsumagoiensis]GCE16019.1 hypothetical protein KTT_58780 [Tengunoibacter tsumagoiensis]